MADVTLKCPLFAAAFFMAIAFVGCSPAASESSPQSGGYPQGAVPLPEPRSTDPASASASSSDAPEISRSVGEPGGILVLWPRVVQSQGGSAKADDATRDLAKRMQARLVELVRGTSPGHPVDVRPEPERVCPRAGCKATTVGVLLARDGEGCAAVLLVSAPGASPAHLVAWLGTIDLSRDLVPFRDPPERHVKVQDYLRCASLAGDATGDGAVQAAIKNAVH